MLTNDHSSGISGTTTSVIDLSLSKSDLAQRNGRSTPFIPLSGSKKRLFDRACDFCRRRKTRCDGSSKPDNVCSNCLHYNHKCTYVESSRPRGPPKAYVISLEDRLEAMEALLRRLRPDEDFSKQLGPPVMKDSWKIDSTTIDTTSTNQESSSKSCSSPPFSVHPPSQIQRSHRARDASRVSPYDDDQSSSESVASSDYEEYTETSLFPGVKALTLHALEYVDVSDIEGHPKDSREDRDPHLRFHGKSSSFHLVRPTREFKTQYMGALQSDEGVSIPQPLRRPYYWTSFPWEIQYEGLSLNHTSLFRSLVESFPPQDLAEKLVELYFRNSHPINPILHCQTFYRQWAVALHRRDAWFAAICMVVFAIASRWSDDPRVLTKAISDGGCVLREYISRNQELAADAQDGKPQWRSAGWIYFTAVLDYYRYRRSVLYPACLSELQFHCLMATYLRSHFASSATFYFASIGLRKAQDVGVHRRKLYNKMPTVEDELWKRSFWNLTGYDRESAAALGRSCCSRDEDMDAELPLEVDDEYWIMNDEDLTFKQPEGKPSVNTAFNLWIKLNQIIAFAVRTIYAVDRTKVVPSGVSAPQWRQDIVRQLNTAMIAWVDSVPEHLKWTDQIEDRVFANQSASLFLWYYSAQILIYKSFIPPYTVDETIPSRHTSKAHVDFPFPALAICINAAKSCLRILKIQLRAGMTDMPSALIASQRSAGILVTHVWKVIVRERSRSMEALQEEKAPLGRSVPELMSDINEFVEILENASRRWPLAGIMVKHLKETLPTGTDHNGFLHRTGVENLGAPTTNYPPTGHLDRFIPSYENLTEFAASRSDIQYSASSTEHIMWDDQMKSYFPWDGLIQNQATFQGIPLSELTKLNPLDDPMFMASSSKQRPDITLDQPDNSSHQDRNPVNPVVKQEVLDDIGSTCQITDVSQYMTTSSQSEQGVSQIPVEEDSWYYSYPGRRDWSVQSNARATYAPWQ